MTINNVLAKPMLRKITVNSKKELADILLSGRTLQTKNGAKIYFDGDLEHSPFAARFKDGSVCAMTILWELEQFYEEVPWQEELKRRPILCWVGDDQINRYPALIKDYKGGFYISVNDMTWAHATPIERDAEELL